MCWSMGSVLQPDPFCWAEAIRCHIGTGFVHAEYVLLFIFRLALCSVMLHICVYVLILMVKQFWLVFVNFSGI